MEKLRVESMTKMTHDRLLFYKGHGKVHSIFDKTLNIATDCGKLITLANSSMRNGPNALMIHNFKARNFQVEEGMEVFFSDFKIQIGHELNINYDHAEIKEYEIIRYGQDGSLRCKKIKTCLKLMKVQEKKDENRFNQAIEKRLNQLRKELQGSVSLEDKKSTLKTLEKFVGLGIGLTPSGDDFLTGFALVVSLSDYPLPWIKKEMNSISEYMLEHTNIISRSQFEMAVQSEAREEVLILLNTILSDTIADINHNILNEVLNIGSSSGSDLLMGILEAITIGGIENGIKC